MRLKELTGDLQLKWGRMQQAMQKINADACLLSVDVNLYYTTGRVYSGYFYLPFYIAGTAAGFIALILRVIKNIFCTAIELKNENELTI